MSTKIEWAEETWNPVTGCTKISEGCQNCYAERMSKRLAGRCGYRKENPFAVTLHPKRLGQPLKWKKPRMIFICSMGDLFHERISFSSRRAIFSVIGQCPQHTFLILTKRPSQMHEFISALQAEGDFFSDHWDGDTEAIDYFPNLWLGVTAENQQRADERIPILLQIPAAVRFVSVEPMLEPIELTKLIYEGVTAIDALNGLHGWPRPHAEGPKLDWVICGGETGPGARPMQPDWASNLKDQCQAAGTPFFFKSWGAWVSPSQMPPSTFREIEDFGDGIGIADNPVKVGKKRTGHLLNGREWNEYPGVRT